jgi:hypothetical protein
MFTFNVPMENDGLSGSIAIAYIQITCGTGTPTARLKVEFH